MHLKRANRKVDVSRADCGKREEPGDGWNGLTPE